MPSPFPGMNPYLEQDDVWHGFHERFIPLAADWITAQVDPKYIVKIDEHRYIHDAIDESRRLIGRGDVLVVQPWLPTSSSAVAQAVSAPADGWLPEEDLEWLSFLEIRDRRNRQLITVVELLSPSNKYRGDDRDQYLAKRRRLLRSEVHLVEIDLLRGADRMPVTGVAASDYLLLVSRAEERPRVAAWPLSLRDPLPSIPIPLSAGDEARLDLQAALHHIYDAARYGTYIYEGQPQPQLSSADALWARQLLTPHT